MVNPLVYAALTVIDVATFLLFVYCIISILASFNVVNMGNAFIRFVFNALESIFTPLLRPIRRIIPSMGGLDLSVLALFILMKILSYTIVYGAHNGWY